MANISAELVAFAKGNADFYVAFEDYHNHKSAEEWHQSMGAYDKNVSLSEKSVKVRNAFFSEIEKISGCKMDEANKDTYFANPMVRYAMMSIVNAAVNVVLPGYVTATFAPFVDFRTVGYADTLKLRIPPKTLYTVSLGNIAA